MRVKPVPDALAEIERACQTLDHPVASPLQRRMVAVIRANVRLLHDATKPLGICGVPGRNGVCIKPPKHGQRHRYGPRPAPKGVDCAWEKIKEFKPEGSRFVLFVGNPCSVRGEGPGGSISHGWTIISMEMHRETGQVNVEVKKDRNGHTRIFSIERIIYKRPKKPT